MSSTNSDTDCFWRFPLETRANILGFLHYDSLLNAIHASKALHVAFTPEESEGDVCRSLLSLHVDENLLPIAFSLYLAENENWNIGLPTSDADPEVLYTEKVVAFCKKHLENLGPDSVNLKEVRGEMTVRILKFHQIALYFANLLARQVGKGIARSRRPNEWLRIVKCVYIFELAAIILGPRIPQFPQTNLRASRSFWRCFAPWEVAGIAMMETCLKYEISFKLARTPTKYPGLTTEVNALSLRRLHPVLCGNPPLNNSDILEKLTFLYLSIRADQLLWYPSGDSEGRRGMEDILNVTLRHQGDQHTGPRDLFLWSYLINRLRENSPLAGMKDGWKDVFHTSFSQPFGHPYMGRYCFQDRHTLEGMYRDRYPTMGALVSEARAIIDSVQQPI
ncbi:hypothetical protein F4776DRAFT_673200 [Hypoxylon sp. NC0597]|nr:hypothetical protein F4776DRAFT_673200 [Hypoxylon sp. NC0597]